MESAVASAFPPATEWLTFDQASKLLGLSHRTAVHRWASKGVSTPRGQVVLESFRVGGRRYTTQALIDRFIARQQPEQGGAPPVLPPDHSKVPSWALNPSQGARLQ